MAKKKKKKGKVIKILLKITIGILVLIALGNIAYTHYEEELLEKELTEILSYDVNKDNFDTPIKTRENYAKIEKSIKKYLNDYRIQVEKVNEVKKENKLENLLSASNYETDGKSFTETNNYLETYKETLQKELEKLKTLSEKKRLDNLIKKQKLPKYYKEIYKEYMKEETVSLKLKKNNETIEKSIESIKNLIEKEKNVINFLKTNEGWIIRNDKIIFYKTEDLNTYNELTKDIVNKN